MELPYTMKASETTLRQKAAEFWNLSSAWNGKPNKMPKLTTQDGLLMCNENMAHLNPTRRLWFNFAKLQTEMIEGGGRKPSTNGVVLLTPYAKSLAR